MNIEDNRLYNLRDLNRLNVNDLELLEAAAAREDRERVRLCVLVPSDNHVRLTCENMDDVYVMTTFPGADDISSRFEPTMTGNKIKALVLDPEHCEELVTAGNADVWMFKEAYESMEDSNLPLPKTLALKQPTLALPPAKRIDMARGEPEWRYAVFNGRDGQLQHGRLRHRPFTVGRDDIHILGYDLRRFQERNNSGSAQKIAFSTSESNSLTNATQQTSEPSQTLTADMPKAKRPGRKKGEVEEKGKAALRELVEFIEKLGTL